MAKNMGTWLLTRIFDGSRAAPKYRKLSIRDCQTSKYQYVQGMNAAEQSVLILFDSLRPIETAEDDTGDQTTRGLEWSILLTYSLERVEMMLQKSTTARGWSQSDCYPFSQIFPSLQSVCDRSHCELALQTLRQVKSVIANATSP